MYGGSNTNPLCSGFCGTVFKINLRGALKTVYNFCSQPNCADGAGPGFSLVQASDGNFYGSTIGADGGNSLYGITLFRLTPGGKLTALHTFQQVFQEPEALVQAGNAPRSTEAFYGVTLEGGQYNNCGGLYCGTLFRLAVSEDEMNQIFDKTGQP